MTLCPILSKIPRVQKKEYWKLQEKNVKLFFNADSSELYQISQKKL
jgi:hypothetical protein